MLSWRWKSSRRMLDYKMMAVDLPVIPWLLVCMDEGKAELARMLYTQVGMAMEDASGIALKLGGSRGTFTASETEKLEQAANTITHLLQAAKALQE